MVPLVVPQPKAVKVYYSACGKIYRYNIYRQESLDMEKKLKTHEWDKRVNIGIFAMIVVNAWLVYKHALNLNDKATNQDNFNMALSEELIDNTYNTISLRWRRNIYNSEDRDLLVNGDGRPMDGVGSHVTPINKKMYGKNKSHTSQLRCRVYSRKITNLYSACIDPIFSICFSKTGRDCFK